jgi:hypothetical protein
LDGGEKTGKKIGKKFYTEGAESTEETEDTEDTEKWD